MSSIYSTLRCKVNGVLAILKFDNWLAILIDRMLLKTPAQVYSLQGRPILIDYIGDDCNGTRDVLVSGMYENYLAAIGPGVLRQVLDIGANGGGFSLLLQLHEVALERLVCVELNPNTFTRLLYNITRNKVGDERHCLNAAVSGHAGYLDLHLGEGSTGDSLASAQVSSMGEIFRVQAITIPEIMQKYFPEAIVDLCKMDIEGGEYDIFSCADGAMFANIRYLLVELHHTDGYSPKEGVAMLRRLGFTEVVIDSGYPDIFLFKNASMI